MEDARATVKMIATPEIANTRRTPSNAADETETQAGGPSETRSSGGEDLRHPSRPRHPRQNRKNEPPSRAKEDRGMEQIAAPFPGSAPA